MSFLQIFQTKVFKLSQVPSLSPAPPSWDSRLTLDHEFHISVLRACHVGGHTTVFPSILLQGPVKVEAAISTDSMLVAWRELVRAEREELIWRGEY